MKKLSLLYAVALATLTMFMTSCGTEEVDPEGPSLKFVGRSSVNEYVNVGDSVVFEIITEKGDKNMTEITFRVGGNAFAPSRYTINGETLDASATYSIPNSEDAGKTYEIVIYASSEETSETIQIAVADKDGLTAGLSATISTDLSALGARTGKVNHALGAEEGAYDLYQNVALFSAGAETSKDIVNTDVNGTDFAGGFTVGTGNGSMFVVDNSFDYSSATKTSISEAYAAGTASATVAPATGDIILVKLRGMDEYAVLKVTEIESTSGASVNGNTGSMSFDYKSSYLTSQEAQEQAVELAEAK